MLCLALALLSLVLHWDKKGRNVQPKIGEVGGRVEKKANFSGGLDAEDLPELSHSSWCFLLWRKNKSRISQE